MFIVMYTNLKMTATTSMQLDDNLGRWCRHCVTRRHPNYTAAAASIAARRHATLYCSYRIGLARPPIAARNGICVAWLVTGYFGTYLRRRRQAERMKNSEVAEQCYIYVDYSSKVVQTTFKGCTIITFFSIILCNIYKIKIMKGVYQRQFKCNKIFLTFKIFFPHRKKH